jgi:hypothetical protein
LTTNLVIFGYFQLLDMLTTVVFLLHGVPEANPLVNFALRMAPNPLMGLFLIKAVALCMALYCWRLGRSSLLLRVNILFAVLVSWNLFALIARSIDLA